MEIVNLLLNHKDIDINATNCKYEKSIDENIVIALSNIWGFVKINFSKFWIKKDAIEY